MPRQQTALSRVLVTLSTIVVVLVLLLPTTGNAGIAAGSDTTVHTVSAGDTLWDIASEVTSPGDDLREMVGRVRRLNDLSSTVIVPGQRLIVPVPKRPRG
jgi:LysM repeat protein